MPTHRYGIMNDRPQHEEGHVGGYVVLQPQLVQGRHLAAVLIGAEVGGKESSELNQCTQTLQGNIIL